MTKKRVSDEFEDTATMVLDPHKLIHHLFTKVGMRIDPLAVKEFWHIKRNVAKEPWAMESPASDMHIPLASYGDSCRIHNGPTKMLGLFISLPLWKAKSTRCSRFCIWACEESRLWKRSTLDTVLQRVTYSLNLLYEGLDEYGQVLAGGCKFTCTELRGDWLWHKECFGFSSSWNWRRKKDICYRCTARAEGPCSTLYFNHWDEHPSWHEYGLAEWIVNQLGHRQRPCTFAGLLAL